MGVEWVADGAVLAAGALFVGFPFGVAVGYAWRDRISHARRIRYEQERRRAELDGAAKRPVLEIAANYEHIADRAGMRRQEQK